MITSATKATNAQAKNLPALRANPRCRLNISFTSDLNISSLSVWQLDASGLISEGRDFPISARNRDTCVKQRETPGRDCSGRVRAKQSWRVVQDERRRPEHASAVLEGARHD